jgi:uncharacterized membrane protein
MVLNAKVREILRVLHKYGCFMTTHEIAKETGFSYKTVIKYLKEMEKMEIIQQVKNDKRK